MSRATSHPFLLFLIFSVSLSVLTLTAFGQSPFSSVKMDVTISREGDTWKANAKFLVENREFSNPASDIKVNGEAVSFVVDLDRTLVRFTGKRTGEQLNGDLEAFEKNTKVASGTWTLTRQQGTTASADGLVGAWHGTFSAVLVGEQAADPGFDTHVAHPAYVTKHPRVLFDEAHNNFHTTAGRYQPFAQLITADGYQVTPNKEAFSAQTLQGYDVLVISNALGPRGQRASAAFTAPECDEVREWVRAGGSLLLIADHAPMGAAAAILSERFGVDMSKAYTGDPANYDKPSKEISQLVFSRENKLLGEHPITRGRRGAQERVNRVVTFTGQSLKGPEGSVAILRLAETAVDKISNGQEVSAAGRAQGVALKFGKGRVVVLGEAAMLTAQISGDGEKFGMNVPGNDDRQFALNVMHWLSGILN